MENFIFVPPIPVTALRAHDSTRNFLRQRPVPSQDADAAYNYLSSHFGLSSHEGAGRRWSKTSSPAKPAPNTRTTSQTSISKRRRRKRAGSRGSCSNATPAKRFPSKIAQPFMAGSRASQTDQVPAGTKERLCRPWWDFPLVVGHLPSHEWLGYFQKGGAGSARRCRENNLGKRATLKPHPTGKGAIAGRPGPWRRRLRRGVGFRRGRGGWCGGNPLWLR